MIQRGEESLDEARASNEAWSDIVRDLLAAGLNDEEIAALLRQQDVWTVEARKMKSEGYPYDDILFRLGTLCASWADVGRALMDAGLSPADMLRAVLPSTESDEHWPVVQAALLDGPEDADYTEVRGVLEYFFMSEEEVLRTLDMDDAQRGIAAQRLGF
jgi:hypothetical protein